MKILWTDLHANIHTHQMDELEEWYNFSKEVTDFWAIAYYPYFMRKHPTGMPVEDLIDREDYLKDWERVKEFVRRMDSEEFPLFGGYEWQGAGLDGDHNVFYKNIDNDMHTDLRYGDLIKKLPKNEAIAIPHHLAYSLGNRGKNWDTHSSEFSPFAEIYSSHGSSENDVEEIHMNRHIHMGPRTEGTTLEDGLNRGHKVGIIASGDNHVVPAMHGHGLMACYVDEKTKDGIFESFFKRHVYGVTGSKTKLYYGIDENLMGSEVPYREGMKEEVKVEAGSAVDRIEFLRNGIVENTYVHNGKWEKEELTGEVEFKFKLELGWGPDLRMFPELTEKNWTGKIKTTGEILAVEKLWSTPGQSLEEVNSSECTFSLVTRKSTQSGKWMGPSGVTNEGFIFNIKASIDSDVVFEIDGKTYQRSVKDILKSTELIGLIDEAKERCREKWGIEEYYRSDPFWHNAHKIKIHRGYPEKAYKVEVRREIKELMTNEDYFMTKIYLKNGEKAWASPIWVKK